MKPFPYKDINFEIQSCVVQSYCFRFHFIIKFSNSCIEILIMAKIRSICTKSASKSTNFLRKSLSSALNKILLSSCLLRLSFFFLRNPLMYVSCFKNHFFPLVCLSASKKHNCQNDSYSSNAIVIPEEKIKHVYVYVHIYIKN